METSQKEMFNEVLSDVKKSGCLGQSRRQEKLFEFLLKETLAGRHEDVTQYAIAVDILDRPETFDATSDSIVRVEMHRLRSNLKKYNSATSNYQLNIPRASYEVVIKDMRKTSGEGLSKAPYKQLALAAVFGTSVFFAGIIAQSVFQTFQPDKNSTPCSTQQPNVFVRTSGSISEMQTYLDRAIRASVAQHTSLNYIEREAECDSRHAPSYVIDYQVLQNAGQFNVSFSTLSFNPETEISFTQFSLPVDTSQENIYFSSIRAVNDIVKPYGIIARKALTEEWGQETAKFDFKCLVQMYDSFDTDKPSDYVDVLDCLEVSVSDDVAPLDNYGALAASYLDQVRGRQDLTVDNPYEKTSALFNTVGDDWINSSEMVMAKMMFIIESERFYPDTLTTVISVAETKYNTHAPVMLTAAIYSGFALGDWEKAKSLSDNVKSLSSDRDNSVYAVDAPYALLYETEGNFFETCARTYSKHIVLTNLIVNRCAKRFGEEDWIAKTDENLKEAGIITWQDRKALIKTQKVEPKLAKILVGQPEMETAYSSAQ